MSTILNNNGEAVDIPTPLRDDYLFYLITAEWNSDITHALRDGAMATLREAGIKEDHIRLLSVPGTVELINAAALICKERPCSGVIVFGCVVRGDTPHFDYVCQQAATGVAILNARGETPVTFGVLTVDDFQQALDRAGGRLGNKGSEAACAALSMANLHVSV